MNFRMSIKNENLSLLKNTKFGPNAGVVLVILSLVLASCSPIINLPSAGWQTDGTDATPFHQLGLEMAFDENSGLWYRVGNDRENLFVMLKTDNPGTRMKILRGGMELQIDTTGGRSAHSIVRFPMEENRITLFDNIPGVREPINPERLQMQQPAQLQGLFREAVGTQTRKSLTGFRNHPNGRIPLHNPEGIQVKMEMDSLGVLHYLAIIPLNTILSRSGTAPLERIIGISIYVKGVSLPGPAKPMFTGPSAFTGRTNRPTLEGAQRERLEREAMRPPVPLRRHELEQSERLLLRYSVALRE